MGQNRTPVQIKNHFYTQIVRKQRLDSLKKELQLEGAEMAEQEPIEADEQKNKEVELLKQEVQELKQWSKLAFEQLKEAKLRFNLKKKFCLFEKGYLSSVPPQRREHKQILQIACCK